MKVTAGLELAIQLLAQASVISNMVATAQNAGREELSDDEWRAIKHADDVARQVLVDAINEAEQEGR